MWAARARPSAEGSASCAGGPVIGDMSERCTVPHCARRRLLGAAMTLGSQGKNPQRPSRHRWSVPPCLRSAAMPCNAAPCAQAALPWPPRPSALRGERHSVGGPANGRRGDSNCCGGHLVVTTGVLVVKVVKARSPHPSRCCAAPCRHPKGRDGVTPNAHAHASPTRASA